MKFLKKFKTSLEGCFSNTIFMFLHLVYVKQEQEALFKYNLVRTKSPL